MARRKSRAKRKFRIRKSIVSRAIRFLALGVPYLISFVMIAGLIGTSYAFAMKGDLFSVRQVRIENGRTLENADAFRFAGIQKFDPIFSIDLKRVERRIRRQNLSFKEVRVYRVLPNEIRVVLRRRDPIAQIEHDLFYMIDSEGIIISGGYDKRDKNLPIIRGMALPREGLGAGMRLDKRIFGKVLGLIQKLKKVKGLQAHSISIIDVVNRKNFDSIEIRISTRNLKGQLDKLEDALAGLDLNPRKIRYIDLRFDGVVVGPR